MTQNLENILASFEDKTPAQPRPLKLSAQQRVPAVGEQRARLGTAPWSARTVPQGRGQAPAPVVFPGNVAFRAGGPSKYYESPGSLPFGVQRFASAQSPGIPAIRPKFKSAFVNGPQVGLRGRLSPQMYGPRVVSPIPGPSFQKFSTAQGREQLSVAPLARKQGQALLQTPQAYPQARTSPGSQRTLLGPPYNGPRQAFAPQGAFTPIQRTSVALSNRLSANAQAGGLQRFNTAGPYAEYRTYNRPLAPNSQPAVQVNLVPRPRPPSPPAFARPLVPRPQLPGQVYPQTLAGSRMQGPASWQASNARMFVQKAGYGRLPNPVVKSPIYSPAGYPSPPRPQLIPRPAPRPAQAPPVAQVLSSSQPNLYKDAQLSGRLLTTTTGPRRNLLSRYLTLPYSPNSVTIQGGDGNSQLIPREGRVVVLQPGQLIPYYKAILAATGRSPQLLDQLQKFVASSQSKLSTQPTRLTDKLRLGPPGAQHVRPRVASLWFPNDPMHARVYTERSSNQLSAGRARAPFLSNLIKNPTLGYSRRVPLYLQSLPYRVYYLSKRDSGITVPSSVKGYITQALSSVLSELGKKRKKKKRKRTAVDTAKT